MIDQIVRAYRRVGLKTLMRTLGSVAALVALAFAINWLDPAGVLETNAFPDTAEGKLRFFLIGLAGMSLLPPRQMVSFLAAYFFGLWWGLAIAIATTVGGCILCYTLARIFHRTIRDYVRGKLHLAMRFWAENTFETTMIVRFLPVGSNFLTNLAAGAFGIPALRFFVGSAVGYLPQTVIFAIMGSGIEVGSQYQFILSVALLVLSGVAGALLYDKHRKRLKLEETEEAGGSN